MINVLIIQITETYALKYKALLKYSNRTYTGHYVMV